jgi:hypothetical protein
MKRVILFLSIGFFISNQLLAITKTWTAGAVVNNWLNDTSWTPFGQPTTADDVIIPSGSLVPANGFYCYMKTCSLQGNAIIDLNANFQVIDSILISQNAVLNWTGGELNGGGSMRNKGTVNILNNTWFCVVQGNNVIYNEGTINLPMVNSTTNTSNFAILNGTINNLATGIIDIKGDGNSFYVSTGTLHQVNNWGVIKKTAGTGNNDFSIFLHNYPSGKIDVNSGTIKLVNYIDTLEGGTYNVASGSQLIINTEAYYYGSLSGVLNGEFVLQGNIRVPTTASFDFTGTSNVVWNNGELSNGGTLTNNAKMMISPICGLCAKYNGTCIFINNDEVSIMNNSLVMGTGFFTNNVTGIVTLHDGAGFYRYLGGTHALTNYGLIQKIGGSGSTDIDLDSIINNGIIECNSGTLKINSWGPNHFINRSIGTIKGNAAFEFPGNQYVNHGITSPGGITADTLWINNNSFYNTTDSSVLDIQLNGNTQGVTFDYLNITNGNANFAGKVKVQLGYAPSLADTFIVAKCSGAITSCTIDSVAVDTFNNVVYMFKVECVNNNALKLSMKHISDPLHVDNLNTLNKFSMYPNPTNDFIHVKFTENITHLKVSITNSTGQVLFNHTYANTQHECIDVSTFAKGIYFIETRMDGIEYVTKFVKE